MLRNTQILLQNMIFMETIFVNQSQNMMFFAKKKTVPFQPSVDATFLAKTSDLIHQPKNLQFWLNSSFPSCENDTFYTQKDVLVLILAKLSLLRSLKITERKAGGLKPLKKVVHCPRLGRNDIGVEENEAFSTIKIIIF